MGKIVEYAKERPELIKIDTGILARCLNHSSTHSSELFKQKDTQLDAHTGHGKSTLKESLASKAGAVYAEVAGGEMHFADSRQEEERDHGTTIKSTAVSTSFELGRPDEIKKIDQRAESREFLINMIDSPGGFDFPSVLTAALYVTDGALLAVDCIDGIGTQTVTALRIALTQRIKPALVVNKIDRAILELKLEKEELYNTFARTIESINAVISTYTSYTYDTLGDLQVHPEKGNVTFASGLHGWGFTLRQFASRYFKKFGVPQDKLMERLWGENYFDPKTSKWTNKSIDIEGKPLERAFNMFILDPIYRLYDAIMHFKKEQVSELLEKLDIQLSSEEKKLEGKQRMKAVMHKFLPCRDAALEMVCIHLPSPVTAQSYRVSNLYQGPLNDECADGIRNCDSHAPLMIYVFKMVPTPDKDRLYALGRVFSGTARADQKVRIMGPKYPPDSKDDLGIEAIQQTVQIMNGAVEAIENCPAGNIVGLVGVDQCLVKSTTIAPRKWLTA